MRQPYGPVPAGYSPDIARLLQLTLEKNPELRASIDDVLALPAVSHLVFPHGESH